jgi:hypothetical protein
LLDLGKIDTSPEELKKTLGRIKNPAETAEELRANGNVFEVHVYNQRDATNRLALTDVQGDLVKLTHLDLNGKLSENDEKVGKVVGFLPRKAQDWKDGASELKIKVKITSDSDKPAELMLNLANLERIEEESRSKLVGAREVAAEAAGRQARQQVVDACIIYLLSALLTALLIHPARRIRQRPRRWGSQARRKCDRREGEGCCTECGRDERTAVTSGKQPIQTLHGDSRRRRGVQERIDGQRCQR